MENKYLPIIPFLFLKKKHIEVRLLDYTDKYFNTRKIVYLQA